MRKAFIIFALMLVITACGPAPTPPPTLRPTLTPTPLSTALPPVDTVVPMGSNSRPFGFVALTTDKSASGSQIAEFLSDKTSSTFKVTLTNDPAEALKLICSETPTAAILDGRTLLAALAQNCGTLAFKMQGKDNNYGVKADIIVRVLSTDKNPPQSPRDLRGRDFCRLNGQDVVSWVLPSLTLKTSGVNPAGDLKGIKEFSTLEAMVQGLADGSCAAAGIPSGTLDSYSSIKVTNGELRLMTSTAELPNGGLIISGTVPKSVSDALTEQVRRNPEEFADVLGGFTLVAAEKDDYSDFIRFAENAGLNLRAIGQ